MPSSTRGTTRAAALLALSLSLAACATGGPRQGVVATSRMGAVKGPGVVARGVVQLEAGYSEGRRDGRTRRGVGEPLLRVGLGRSTELRATFPSYLRTVTPSATAEGAGDASLAVKHRFRPPAGWLPGVSVTLGSTLPTGADAVGAGAAQPEGSLAAEWRAAPRLAVVGTAGWRHAVAAGDRFGQTTLGAAGRADLTSAITAQVEGTLVSATRAGVRDVSALRATAAMRLTPDLQLDGWVGRATQPGAPGETLFGVGFTRRW